MGDNPFYLYPLVRVPKHAVKANFLSIFHLISNMCQFMLSCALRLPKPVITAKKAYKEKG